LRVSATNTRKRDSVAFSKQKLWLPIKTRVSPKVIDLEDAVPAERGLRLSKHLPTAQKGNTGNPKGGVMSAQRTENPHAKLGVTIKNTMVMTVDPRSVLNVDCETNRQTKMAIPQHRSTHPKALSNPMPM
jgi:hypothetical protein